MAVTAVTTSMAGAINYTHVTDTSADFASVANSTYFYNKADKLVRFKDATGAVLEIFSASGGASGIFGISNSSGVYTYYATPALAYAAATAGQTIEMFADYTTSSADVITITKNVNWNGNGHTWTKTSADATEIFISTYALLNFTMNLNLVRTNSVSVGLIQSSLFFLNNGCAGRIIMTGSYFENKGVSALGHVAIGMYSVSVEIIGLIAKSGNVGAFVGTYGVVTNCIFYGVTGCQIDGTANNCIFYGTTGSGVYASALAILNNCIAQSVSGSGINLTGIAFNTIGRSTSGYGIEASNSKELTNCTGISVTSNGIYLYAVTSKNISNNTAISSSGYGIRFQSGFIANSTFISTSNASVWDTASSGKLYNCNLITNYNNAVGYGILGNAGTLPVSIIDCRFILANSSANYMNNGGTAKVISMRGNTYEGGAAFNANITQGITTTEDNQGNIYL